MCLAVPAKIQKIENGMATCQVGEGTTTVEASLLIMDEDVGIDDYVIIHAGFAIRKLDPQEAAETLKILRDLVNTADEMGIDFEHI